MVKGQVHWGFITFCRNSCLSIIQPHKLVTEGDSVAVFIVSHIRVDTEQDHRALKQV